MSSAGRCRLASVVACVLATTGHCFSTLKPLAWPLQSSSPRRRNARANHHVKPSRGTTLNVVPLNNINLVAGMLGGAIGVGVAYPFDTIKVKMQSFQELNPGVARPTVWMVARQSLKDEGVQSFYGGVAPTMAGQALVKGCAFWAYTFAQVFLAAHVWHGAKLGAAGLCLAAMMSGVVSAFIVTPVERIKCVMQAAKMNRFNSPLACVQDIVRIDGFSGLFGRGLLVTLLREVPSYAIYFATYEFTKATMLRAIAAAGGLPTWLPSLVPLVGGAAAGVAAWVPVYPIDVVKTNVQVSVDGGRREGAWKTARRLYQESGPGVFWVGLGPKLARAVVNHAVTFLVFESVVKFYAGRA